LSFVENTGRSGAEGEATEFRDFLNLLDRLSEHREESNTALFLIDVGSSGLLTVDNKVPTISVPSSNSRFIRDLMTGSLSEIVDSDLVAFQLIVLLVFGHHLTLPLDVVGVSSSRFDFDFTLNDQEGAPYVFHVEAHAFLLTDGEDFSSRGPTDVSDLLRGMVTKVFNFKTSTFVLVALVQVNTLPHGTESVVLLTSLKDSLGVSVDGESAVYGLPGYAVELLDFTLNLYNFVRDTVGLLEVEDFN